MTRSLLLPMAVVIWTLIGCASNGSAPSSAAGQNGLTDSATMVDCGASIESLENASHFPESYDVVAGVVGWPSRPVGRGPRSEDGRNFSKVGIIVRAGARIAVTVGSTEPDGVLLTYSGQVDTTLMFDRCDAAGDWTVFPGGLWIDPAVDCFELTVEADNSSESRWIGIETACTSS